MMTNQIFSVWVGGGRGLLFLLLALLTTTRAPWSKKTPRLHASSFPSSQFQKAADWIEGGDFYFFFPISFSPSVLQAAATAAPGLRSARLFWKFQRVSVTGMQMSARSLHPSVSHFSHCLKKFWERPWRGETRKTRLSCWFAGTSFSSAASTTSSWSKSKEQRSLEMHTNADFVGKVTAPAFWCMSSYSFFFNYAFESILELRTICISWL